MARISKDPLQSLVIITSQIRIWSGGTKLTRDEDLSNVKDQLPPAGMVTDGRKNLVKPSALAPFHAIRKRLERLLTRHGFRIMADAFAVPASEIDEILKEIDELEQSFHEAVPVFLDALPHHYQEQMNQFPGWAEQLRAGQLKESDVRSRLRFAVGVYKMAPPDSENAASPANRQYSNVVNSAVPALLSDIAAKAEALLKGPIGQKQCVTQSQHEQVRKLVTRLEAFSFLDHRVGPTSSALLDMLSCIPLTGPLTPGNSALLRVVVEQLSDPDTVLQQYTSSDDDELALPTPAVSSLAPAAPVPQPSTAYVGV